MFVRARFLGPAPALVSTLARTPFTPFTSFSRVHLFSHVKPNPGRAGDRDQTWVNDFDECERYRDINGAVRADRSELFVRARSRWSAWSESVLRTHAYMHILTEIVQIASVASTPLLVTHLLLPPLAVTVRRSIVESWVGPLLIFIINMYNTYVCINKCLYYKESKTPGVASRADPTWGVITVAGVEKIRKKG